MAYTRIARWDHYDPQGTAWRIDLLQEGAAFDDSRYNLTGNMFTLTHEGDLIKEGRLEVEWLIENSTQYAIAEGLVGGLVDEYRFDLRKDGSTYWKGFLQPGLIELTEGDYPRRVKLTAKDGTPFDQFFARDTDKTVRNYDTLIDLIAECLWGSNNIRTYTNWSHNSLGSGDWLNQTYVDRYVFRVIDKENPDGDQDMTVREVLENILFVTDTTLIQSAGEWHLMQRDNLDNSTYTRYNYSSSGFASGSTSGLDLDFTIGTNNYLLPQSTAFWQGGLRQNSFKYEHNTQGYGIALGTLGYLINDGDPNFTFSQTFQTDGGYSIRYMANVTSEIEKEFEEVRTICTVNIEIRVGSPGNYTYWDGAKWTETQTNVKNITISGKKAPGFDDEISTRMSGEVLVETSNVPAQYDGTIQLTLKNSSKAGETVEYTRFENNEFALIGEDTAENTASLGYSLTTDRIVTLKESYGEYIIGEGPAESTRGALRYSSGSDFLILDGDFNRVGVDESLNLGEMILRSRMDFFRRARKTIRAEIYAGYEAHKILSYDSSRFVFDRGVLVGRDGRWRSTYMIEINPESAGDLSATDTFDISEGGYIPAAGTPADFEGRSGITFVPGGIDSVDFNFGSDGASAPVERDSGEPLETGDLVYNTVNGDTVPYRFLKIQKYLDKSDFRLSTDGFAATGGTLTFGEQSAIIGERGTNRGLLEFVSNTTGSGSQYILNSSPTYTGYFRVQVFIPSTNSTLLGVEVRPASGSIGTTTTTNEWVTIEGSASNAAELYIYGTDSGLNRTFTRTNGDIFLVRNVDYFGNVVALNTSGEVSDNYNQIAGTYRENDDILMVQDVTDGSLENWGYIEALTTSPANLIDEVGLTGTTKLAKYIIYGLLRRALTSIKGDYIQTGTLDASLVNVTNLNADNITTWTATVDGTLTIGSGGSIVGSNYSFDDTGGTIAGWTIDAAALTSASTGARIELRQDDKRVLVHDGTNEIVAMGFLDGLPKNDGTGNWTSTTYGFWARDSELLVIDGDVTYESGDWIIEDLGAYIVLDNSDNEVIRLGYFDPPGDDPLDYGLWFLRNDGNLLGYVKGDEIKIGVSGQSMTYTPTGGLVVEGTVTATSLVTTNYSATSAGVTIDEDGLEVNEGIVVGDSGTAGKIQLKTAGGTTVGEILAAGALTTSSMVLSGTAANEYLTLQSGPASTTVESDIQLLGTGSTLSPSVAQVLVDPLLNIGTSVSSYTGKLHIAGDVRWDGTTTTSATAGTNGDVPAQVVGYLQVNISGTNRKIPFYA